MNLRREKRRKKRAFLKRSWAKNTMPQYYIHPENISDGHFSASEEESHHIIRVARKRLGEEITIFDGQGGRYLAVIEAAGTLVSGKVKEKLDSPVYKTRLMLCFAPVSRSSAEAIIEHCTEAGVAAFQPVLTSRTQFDWFESWPERSVRFETLMIAACKQCGRAKFPDLLKPAKFDDLLAAAGPAIIASADAVNNFEALSSGFQGVPELKVFIGPEGGFTRGELEYAAEKGVKSFTLGKHTLRAETAALAATAIILDRLG